MPHSDLSNYRDGFFGKFLADLPNTPSVASLEERQPAGSPLVLLGDYVEYSGTELTPLPNGTIRPQFAIRTGEGDAVQTYVILWVVERLDVATDSAGTMARILADFRSPTATQSADSESLTSEQANTWSQALANDTVRQALARNLGDITAVPEGLPTSDLEELRTFLAYFGTYKADGTYYAKGQVSEGEFPAGVSTAYLAADTGNLSEVRLPRDCFYCSALVSEQLWSPRAPATRFRQLVYRIEDQGEEATDRWRLSLLHTVSANRPESAAFSRFIFFHADVGLGLAIPEGARSAMAPSTAEFLQALPARLAALADALRDPDTPIVGTEQAPYVLLTGAVTEDFPRTDLPEGVIVSDAGAVRTFRSPPGHVAALSEREDVQNLELSTPVWPDMVHAMQELKLGERTFPTGVTAANSGHGVVVGIVDTGIDGGHPAFLGRHDDATKSRIHSVWNMWEHGGQSPWQRSSQSRAYRTMPFGKEYIGHDEVITATDHNGHGTHVSGIAAGRAFDTWPGGIAPGATIVVAGVGANGYVNDVIEGVRYCFQKATELSLPCVVNISLSTQRHSHDGTDPLSIALTQMVSSNFIPATGLGVLPSAMPGYIDGRVICAAAGNLRGDDLHWQATIPAGGETSVLYQPFSRGANSQNEADGVTFWAYNEDGTTVRLRLSTRHSSNAVLATGEVGLMTSGGAVSTDLPGHLRVNIHNGPERPNNRHFNPEIYWIRPAPHDAVATAPWIIRIRNTGRSACIIHGFAAFREHAGGFVFNAAQTQPLIGVTYTAAQLRQFESHKVGTPGNAHGTIGVAAYTCRPGMAGQPVDELARFTSPGPLRAAAPGQRAIDVATPGNTISSAKSWKPTDHSRGVVDMHGTSMASPMMTGLVAALLQMNANLDTGEIRNRLEIASSRRPTDSIDDWGLGRVDASLFLRP